MEEAFNNCQLKDIKLPKNLKIIGIQAFSDCDKLKRITIPKKVRTIYESAFIGCTNVKTLNFNAQNCKFKYFKSIAYSNMPFEDLSNLKNINIGKHVERIPEELFLDGIKNKLKTVTVHKNLKEIDYKSFHYFYNQTGIKPIESSNTNVIKLTEEGKLLLVGTGKASLTIKINDKTKTIEFVVL